MNVPSLQVEHEIDSSFEIVPAGHCWQEVADSFEKVPAGHGTQKELLTVE